MKYQSWRLLTHEDMKESSKGLSEFEQLVQVCRVARDLYDQENPREVTNNNNVNSKTCFVPDKVYDKSWGKRPIQEDGASLSKDAVLVGSVSCIPREDLFKGSKTDKGESSSGRFCRLKIKRSVVNHGYLEDSKVMKSKDFDGYFLNNKSDRFFEEVFDDRKERKRSRKYFDSCEDGPDYEYFEKKNNNKNKNKNKKRHLGNKFVVKHKVDNVSPMPEELRNRIQEMRGTDIKLVIQKHLFSADLASGQNRFSIPIKQIREDFLTDEEKNNLDERYEDNHLVPIMVQLIEPNLEKTEISFKKWAVNSFYVLSRPWNDIRDRNGLKVGMEMQLWSFRVDGVLNLALVKVSRDDEQAH